MANNIKLFYIFGNATKSKAKHFRQTNVAFFSADVVFSKEDVGSSLYAIVSYTVDLIIAVTPITFLP